MYTAILADSKSNEEINIDLLEVNKQLATIVVNTSNQDILLEVVQQLTTMNATLMHIDSLLTPPAPAVVGIGIIPGPVTERS